MPSGRWVRTILTKHGYAACHVWVGGTWEVSRGGKPIANGSSWSGCIEECMEQAETWLHNLIEREK